MAAQDYHAFLDHKAQLDGMFGFAPVWQADYLFDFQADLVDWALRKGRAAIFADCGLGKTPMQLAWAENVHRKTGRPVLLVAPLAVSAQTVREGRKFDIDVARSEDGTVPPGARIVTTNYERLHHFNPADFAGTVCDESSVLKSFNGTRRKEVTRFMRKQEFRLLATATAAPNDFVELGTSSEALGYLGHMDMLGRFFKNDQNSTISSRGVGWRGKGGEQRSQWRFKGHAEQQFWRWVASWARAMRRPSDLGYSDDRFALPPLNIREHLLENTTPAPGMLFTIPAVGLREQRDEARRTIPDRCEMAAELVNSTGEPAIVWCHFNDEGDLLTNLIPDARQVSGSDSQEHKEQAVLNFLDGNLRVLVSKPKIFGWGLNLQHCAHMTFFPTHSYESYYQAVRRCWRFGQERPVTVDIVTTDGGRDVMLNLQRKAEQADRMFESLVAHMNDAVTIKRDQDYTEGVEVPSWL